MVVTSLYIPYTWRKYWITFFANLRKKFINSEMYITIAGGYDKYLRFYAIHYMNTSSKTH